MDKVKEFRHAFSFQGYGNTHPGNYSKHNEDSAYFGSTCGTSVPLDTEDTLTPKLCEEVIIAAVADGVGGSEAGEDASFIAIETLKSFLGNHSAQVSAESVAPLLSRLIKEIHRSIIDEAKRNPAKDGMATTITALCIFSFGAWLVQVGDSRLYLFRSGKLSQISQDHSPVGKLVREGKISEEEAMIHPLRNYIDQALGGKTQCPDGTISKVEIKDGDVIMLCTDGLSDSLYPEQIRKLFSESKGPNNLENLGYCLMDSALSAAGRDNLSVVLCRPIAQNPIKRVVNRFTKAALTTLPKSTGCRNTP